MFGRLLCKIKNWRKQQIARRKLALLDDWLLADLGAERGSLNQFVAHHTH
jgi:uncharacterized protein YjiS (DUF1127 family)